MMKSLPRALLVIWVIIWVLFLIRPYFKKDLIGEYASLMAASADGKRSSVTGERLYEFIRFCNDSMHPPSTYNLVGIEYGELEHRRAVYYLYPNTERSSPEFLLVYDVKDYAKTGYGIYKNLDSGRYILKKAD